MLQALIIGGLILGGSLWLNNGKTPKPTNAEYLNTYRILHSDNKSDAEILQERNASDVSKAQWKHSNKILAEEFIKQGKEKLYKDFTIQKNIYQIQFHNAYYDKNISPEEFVSEIR